MMQARSVQSIRQSASTQLMRVSDVPSLEAELLLSYVIQRSREFVYAHPEHVLTESEWSQFQSALERRLTGEPLPYITGEKEFWSLSFEVTPSVLIPRPETEQLVALVLDECKHRSSISILELGTGSGAISIALAHERSDLEIIAVDISDEALCVAKQNAERHGASSIQFLRSNWFSNVPEKIFDIIVSNPPYLSKSDGIQYGQSLKYEPQIALYSGESGQDAIRLIASGAPRFLKQGGVILCEHGHLQAEAVSAVLMQNQFENVATLCDLNGLPRITRGVWKRVSE